MSSLEAYLRQSFYKDYRDDDEVGLEEHLCFHLGDRSAFTTDDKRLVKDLLGDKNAYKLPAFVSVALLIDLVLVMMD